MEKKYFRIINKTAWAKTHEQSTQQSYTAVEKAPEIKSRKRISNTRNKMSARTKCKKQYLTARSTSDKKKGNGKKVHTWSFRVQPWIQSGTKSKRDLTSNVTGYLVSHCSLFWPNVLQYTSFWLVNLFSRSLANHKPLMTSLRFIKSYKRIRAR